MLSVMMYAHAHTQYKNCHGPFCCDKCLPAFVKASGFPKSQWYKLTFTDYNKTRYESDWNGSIEINRLLRQKIDNSPARKRAKRKRASRPHSATAGFQQVVVGMEHALATLLESVRAFTACRGGPYYVANGAYKVVQRHVNTVQELVGALKKMHNDE